MKLFLAYLFIFFVSFSNGDNTVFEFETINFDLSPNTYQVFELPSISGYMGIINVDFKFKKNQEFDVYAKHCSLPNPTVDLPVSAKKYLPAAGSGDQCKWFLLVKSRNQAVVQGNIGVSVVETQNITFGEPSSVISLLTGEMRLFRLPKISNVATLYIDHLQVNSGMKLFVGSGSIPSIDTNTPITKFPAYQVSQTTDNVDWWLLVEAAGDISQDRLIVSSIPSIPITNSGLQFVSDLRMNQKLVYKFYQIDSGGIMQVKVPTESQIQVSVSQGTLNSTQVVTGSQVLFSSSDSQTWYFVIETNCNCNVSLANFTVIPVNSQYIRGGGNVNVQTSSPDDYRLYKLVGSPGTGGIVQFIPSGNLYGSVHSVEISGTLAELKSTKSFISSTNQDGVTWWIVIGGSTQSGSFTVTSIQTQYLTPDVPSSAVYQSGDYNLYRLPASISFGSIISIQSTSNTTNPASAIAKVYCSGWSTITWRSANLSNGKNVFGSESSDDIDWWILIGSSVSTNTITFTVSSKYSVSINDGSTQHIPISMTSDLFSNANVYKLTTQSSFATNGVVKVEVFNLSFQLSPVNIPTINWNMNEVTAEYYDVATSYTDQIVWWVVAQAHAKQGQSFRVSSIATQQISSGIPFSPPADQPLSLYHLPAKENNGVIQIRLLSNSTIVFAGQSITNESPIYDGQWLLSTTGHNLVDWYILVQNGTDDDNIAGSVEVITPPIYHFCSPVLLCNGHGTCRGPTDAIQCHCIDGYSGLRCDIKAAKSYFWIIIDVAILIFILITYYGYKYTRDYLRRRRAKNPVKRYTLIDDQEIGTFEGFNDSNPTVIPYTLRIDFEDLVLEKNGKKILDNVSGSFQPGRLAAIMGASGSGKTSLLSVLSGKVDKSGGIIKINQTPSSIRKYQKLVGFVPQEDIMHRTLTVKENILFSADVRLPTAMPTREKHNIVSEVIDLLGLNRVRHSMIGNEENRGISGGERKRVNIGLELVARPSVLFLDEPTSGLDATTTREIIGALKKIAASGVNIIAVLHQPRYEVFRMFDDIMLLSGGKTVYMGPSNGAVVHFQKLGYQLPDHTNPADFLIDTISGSTKESLITTWQEKPKIASIPPVRSYAEVTITTAGFFKQIWLFLCRSFVQQSRDIASLYLDSLLVFISGSILGFSYQNSKYVGPVPETAASQCPEFILPTCLLPREDFFVAQGSLSCLALGMTAAATSLRTFGNEKPVFWREAGSGANIASYFLGKNLASIPSLLLPPIIYLSVFYLLTGSEASFVKLYLLFLSIQFTCVGIGYFISIVLKPSNSLIAAVVCVVIFVVFSGFNPTLSTLRSYGIIGKVGSSISFARWATEAFYLLSVEPYEDIYNISTGLQFWDYNEDDLHLCFYLVFAIGVAFRLVALVALYIVDRDKRK